MAVHFRPDVERLLNRNPRNRNSSHSAGTSAISTIAVGNGSAAMAAAKVSMLSTRGCGMPMIDCWNTFSACAGIHEERPINTPAARYLGRGRRSENVLARPIFQYSTTASGINTNTTGMSLPVANSSPTASSPGPGEKADCTKNHVGKSSATTISPVEMFGRSTGLKVRRENVPLSDPASANTTDSRPKTLAATATEAQA